MRGFYVKKRLNLSQTVYFCIYLHQITTGNMNAYKYFIQGFLFVFGLSSVPFQRDVEAKEKIAHYWHKAASHIANAFYFETSTKTK